MSQVQQLASKAMLLTAVLFPRIQYTVHIHRPVRWAYSSVRLTVYLKLEYALHIKRAESSSPSAAGYSSVCLPRHLRTLHHDLSHSYL